MSPKFSDTFEDEEESPARARKKSKEMTREEIHQAIGKHFEAISKLCAKLKEKKEDDDGDDAESY